jgi:hypothetical protein
MMAQRVLNIIERETGKDSIEISIGFAGQIAPNFGLNNMILLMRGPDDGMLRVALREGSGVKLDALRETLRTILPTEIAPWLAGEMVRRGVDPAIAATRSKEISFGFEPGDMISNVMSFGSPTP